jgi:hypothetical protein
VADSCSWTREGRQSCTTVLRFLAAFDRGQAETACRQLSGRFLAQRNIGGLTGCAAYLRSHGANRRIEYSIVGSRTRPDGGEVVYTINPPGRRNAERRFVAITIVEHGVSRIDALTEVAPLTRETAGTSVAAGPAGSDYRRQPNPGPSIAEPWTLSDACTRDVQRASACRTVVGYFRAINSGRYETACSLLGERLLAETGGASCPSWLRFGGQKRYGILGAKKTSGGIAVLVAVDFNELGHARQLDWIAIVGREGGALRILDTVRTT